MQLLRSLRSVRLPLQRREDSSEPLSILFFLGLIGMTFLF